MLIQKDIAARTAVGHIVNTIMIDLNSNKAFVQIQVTTAEGGQNVSNVTVDLNPLIAGATITQRSVIRGFIRQIIAGALVVNLVTIPEAFV